MVFDILLENKDRHLTADEIFEKLRKSGEAVETATAIFILAEKNISLEGILEPDTQKIFS